MLRAGHVAHNGKESKYTIDIGKEVRKNESTWKTLGENVRIID
jgi:hypothetical protein